MSSTNSIDLLKGAILEVPMDKVQTLRPGDRNNAIGTRNLNGCTAIVVIGTGENDGIIMAHIGPRAQPGMSSGSSSAGSPTQIKNPVTAGEKHFMKLLREVTGIYFKERRSSISRSTFSSPRAFGIFGRFEGEVPLDHLRERAQQAFEHINIRFQHFTYEVIPRETTRTTAKGTVVAVRMSSGFPELYVEDKLVYPADNTGALAVEMSKLGVSGYEQDDEEEDESEEEEEEDEEEEGEDQEEGDESDDDDEEEEGDDDEEEGGDDDEEEAGNRGTLTRTALAGANTRIHSTTPTGTGAQSTAGASAGASTQRSTVWSFHSQSLGGNCTYYEDTDMIRRPDGTLFPRPFNIPPTSVKKNRVDSTTPTGSNA